MKEVLDSKNLEKWREVLDVEYSLLINNEIWELVLLLKDVNIVGLKWVLKVK